VRPSASKKITVLLADDHAIVRQGLCSLLSTDGDFVVVGQARNGREAVQMARQLRPTVILMDIAMPVLNGLEATRQILAENPSAKVVILSAHSDEEYVERMRAEGASGFLEKQTSGEILTKALHEVAKGNRYFGSSPAERARDNSSKPNYSHGLLRANGPLLSAREAEVLQLTAEGFANKEIATQLGLGIKTIEKHRQRVMAKLDIHDTAGLTRYAVSAGLIENSVQLTIL
jgi:DNA-binding NarL/FixJ family response regulator